MAVSLLALPQPGALDVTTDTTPDKLTQITLPSNVANLLVSVYTTGTDVYLTYTGTDATAVGAAVKVPIPSKQWTPLDQLGSKLFVGSASPSVGVKLVTAVAR